jgi:moderate conductance mechanosensitive channel
MRLFRYALMLLWIALSAMPAWSQAAAGATADSPTTDSTATASQPSTAALRQLRDTLQDPQKRDQLIAQVTALLALEESRVATPTPPGIGARLLDTLSYAFSWVADGIDILAARFADPAPLWQWARSQITDPQQRALWRSTMFYIAVVVAGGFLTWLAVGFALGRARRGILNREPSGWGHRIRLTAGRLALDLVPIVAFAAVALVLVGWARPPAALRLILLAIINATILSLVAIALVRMLLSPIYPRLRLVPLEDATAAYLYIWARRMIVVPVSGYILLQAAILLGIWPAAYRVIAELLGLFVVGLLAVFILQNRDPVAAWICGNKDAEPGTNPMVPAVLRARLSRIWHVAAVLYIATIYAVWALAIPGAPAYLMWATSETAVVVVVLALGEAQLRYLLARGLAVEDGLLGRYPLAAQRAGRYLPILRAALIYALRAVAIVVVLAAWQVNLAALLVSPVGAVAIGHVAGIALILLLALLVWELAGGAISAYLQRIDGDGQTLVRSVRARTLLPLIRNVLLIAVSVMAALAILSELGVNIAPLLAGAGVVGLAIGIGAQSLVKDVITGAFMLFEDTINIGDVVEMNGQRGRIEGLTVRTIRLRDLTGGVHTVPFGAVTTVTNMTKEYSYYMLDIGVAYRENTDEVVEILRDVDREIREDDAFGVSILEPIDILGVDRFADSAVYIRARTKTVPTKQWMVGREFNRRIKLKFDELGIEIPFPHTTLYFGENKHGDAPPARLLLRREARG